MRCPFCSNKETQVRDSRPSEDNSTIRRRRVCPGCGGRFTTFERVQLRELYVLKRTGQKVVFDRDKEGVKKIATDAAKLIKELSDNYKNTNYVNSPDLLLTAYSNILTFSFALFLIFVSLQVNAKNDVQNELPSF